jgi:hypothetical protein
MKKTFTSVSGCVLKIGYIAFFFFGFAVPSTAQVSPNEILANSDITNQELLDKGQALVNGVRIALNLQAAE